MSKHSLDFKLSVLEFYEKGKRSARDVCVHFGHSAVRKWVASYEAHGAAGLAKKFSHYDAALKLSVLQRMWEAGLS
jgi:transposase